MRPLLWPFLALVSTPLTAQEVVWVEDFENGCTQNCQATTYSGPNGIWSTMSTGTNGACANVWFVSCQENGNPVGTCGSGCGTNETLHIGNNAAGCTSPNSCLFCPTGDCGAAYDASCPPALCGSCCSCQSSQTSVRAVSPIINLTGSAAYTLRFKYMEGGSGANDNALLDYYDGGIWTTLVDLPKTPVGSCGGQGTWTSFSIALPASANNNPAVRIGFRWMNNNDGIGADPSVAIDDVEILAPYAPMCAGLLVNEVSNGASGTREYVELLVCGPACGTVDLRGWKIDDNNGSLMNGFGTQQVTSGVSSGHLRFANVAQWAAVPSGSLIVLYNVNDRDPLIPPNDPYDTAPANGVYILPATHTSIQGCSSWPGAASSAGYGNVCTFGAGNWNMITFRNEGDAVQTRDPMGVYFHGVSYGPDAQNMNSGGIDALRISTLDHTGRVLLFSGNDPRQASSYTSLPVAGNLTPGAPNSAANQAYINTVVCTPLPVELIFFTAEALADRVRLRWATATETNSARYLLDRAGQAGDFATLAELPAAGYSQTRLDYTWDDPLPLPGTSYYRLRQEDLDGSIHAGSMAVVRWSDPAGAVLPVEGEATVLLPYPGPGSRWRLLDATGRVLAQDAGEGTPVRIAVPPGWSILEVLSAGSRTTYRLAATISGVLVSPAR